MKKKITNANFIKDIKTKFELGVDLIDLSLEYKVNYGTLRNISSKQNWEKGRLTKIVNAKEALELIDVALNKRKEVKEDYVLIVDGLREFASRNVKTGNKVKKFSKAAEEGFKNRVQAVKELFSMDKELHGIYSEKEIQEIKTEQLKYEKLKKEVEEGDNTTILE